jgi:peptidoglycan/LPS O-acetylase OafA/YrhL
VTLTQAVELPSGDSTLKLVQPGSASHLAYRPDIDGLRAIAVLSVVLFHIFPTLLTGGFVGVDIFFIISGYLISSIIFNDLKRNRFSFLTFYTRRIKRIFPTLLLVLVSVTVAGWLLMLPSEFIALAKSIKYTTIFTTNGHLYNIAGYFDSVSDLKPLLHIWSLSIEEQFYIGFPLITFFLYKLRQSYVFWFLVIATAVSFVLNVGFIHDKPDLVFYMLPFRAWELLMGCLLAYSMNSNGTLSQSNKTVLPNVLSLIGLGLILWGCVFLTEKDVFPGWYALLPTIGTCLVIANGSAWLNRHVLSNRVIVWVGLISYALYLWHWPLISFAYIVSQGTDGPELSTRVWILIISFALAAVTTFLVEKPIRRGSHKTVYPLCLAMLLVGLGAMALSKFPVKTFPLLNDRNSELTKFEMATKDWDHPTTYLTKTDPRGFPFRSYGTGDKVVFFFGDSNMKQYWPRIEKLLSQDQALRERYTAVFAVHHGQFPHPSYPTDKASHQFLIDAESMLFDPRISTVVIAASWAGYKEDGDELNDKRYRDLETLLQRLKEHGKRVFLILNIPLSTDRHTNTNPISRLERGLFYISPTRATAFPLKDWLNVDGTLMDRLRRIASATGAIVLDPADAICPNGNCALIHGDGIPTYKDGCHLTATYSRENATFIDQIFKD